MREKGRKKMGEGKEEGNEKKGERTKASWAAKDDKAEAAAALACSRLCCGSRTLPPNPEALPARLETPTAGRALGHQKSPAQMSAVSLTPLLRFQARQGG